MMYMKGEFMLFLSLALGYVVCVLASKEKNMLRTVGYTIGISIITLSLVSTLLASMVQPGYKGKMPKHMCGMYKMHKMKGK